MLVLNGVLTDTFSYALTFICLMPLIDLTPIMWTVYCHQRSFDRLLQSYLNFEQKPRRRPTPNDRQSSEQTENQSHTLLMDILSETSRQNTSVAQSSSQDQ